MKLKITVNNQRLQDLGIGKDQVYEVDEDQSIIIDMYKIKVPMKRKGEFRFALISEDEGELIED